MRLLVDKLFGACIHIPLTPWAVNLALWAQRETAQWRYFRIYFEARGKYPRFFWTPVVRRIRRLDA